MTGDLWLRIHKAIKAGPDMRVPVYPGGYTPPAKGIAYARLVGYFELGKHAETSTNGETVLREKVDLIFELSGPNHPPRMLEDGTLVPHRVTVQETLSLDPWANFFNLFAAMNEAHGGMNTHMVQLLDKPFVVEVFHRRSRDGRKVHANLKGPYGYNISGVSYDDPVTGKSVLIEVMPAVTALRAFVWAVANKAMWDSIYIPGFYDEVKDEQGNVIKPKLSKNVLQERIMTAKNWPEHPLAAIVGGSAGM